MGGLLQVTESGYRWVDAVDAEGCQGRYLTDGPLGFRIVRGVRPPLVKREESALFHVFAHLEPSEEGFAAFAARWGLLGVPVLITVPGEARAFEGEAFDVWQAEAGVMREALGLWRMIRDEDRAALEQFIAWEPDGSGVRYTPAGRRAVVVAGVVGRHCADDAAPPVSTFQQGDVLAPAREHLRAVINHYLVRHTAARMAFTVTGTDLRPAARTLLGTLWLQFAQAFAESRTIRLCAVCKTPFQVDAELPGRKHRDVLDTRAARERARYCSRACQSRAARQKVAKALERHQQGMSVPAIAALAESDVETVQGWIEEAAAKAAAPKRPRGRPRKQS